MGLAGGVLPSGPSIPLLPASGHQEAHLSVKKSSLNQV